MNTQQHTTPYIPCQADLDELEAWHAARDIAELAILRDHWDRIADYILSFPSLRPQGPDWSAGLTDILNNRPSRCYPTHDYTSGLIVAFQLLSAAEMLANPDDTEFDNRIAPNAICLSHHLTHHRRLP